MTLIPGWVPMSLGNSQRTPEVVATTVSGGGATTTHNVTIPAGEVGDLLLVIADYGSSGGTPGPYDAPSGWTRELVTNISNLRSHVFMKRADSADSEVVNFASTGSTRSSRTCYRIKGAATPVFSTPTTGTVPGNGALSISAVTISAQPIIYIGMVYMFFAVTNIIIPPSGYSDLLDSPSGAGAGNNMHSTFRRAAITGNEGPIVAQCSLDYIGSNWGGFIIAVPGAT